ncbi:MAG: ATP-binding protein [Crocinitomicaceae bacterium]|nr:ATP-binding protein [Crocinitomicaceae bacterium]
MKSAIKHDSQYTRSLIEASLDPLVTINAEGKITDMNEATVNVIGMTRKELTGTDFFDYFTDPQKAREVYQEVFANGSVTDSPLCLRDSNDKLTDVLLNGSVYKDDCGNVMGVVIVARDVTERNRSEQELIEAKVFAEMASSVAEIAKIKAENAMLKAEDAVKAKQQFLSNMSHEIRTPMNSILGFTKVILKTELTAKQKEYLSAIKLSGDAMIVLINDILDLAQVDSGKMIFEETPFRLSNSISTMLHLFETKIQEQNLKLVEEYDTRIPAVILGDAIRLHQIFINLVSNAVKFTSKGKIVFSTRMVREDKENILIEFSVSDTGIGISPENRELIFDNFQQATNSTSRLYGGTGLGLAIVKKLVESQGGQINVYSVLGEGTTFSFSLNFKKTNKKAKQDVEYLEMDEAIQNIKVLVVEDIPLNQLLMKAILDEFGFEREFAENGRVAIEMLEKNEYDVILMDLQMPEMNGFEATTHIREVMKLSTPIIALTADVTTVDFKKCVEIGMNDYIAKPVDERILYSKIVHLVSNHAEQEEIEASSTKEIVIELEKSINLEYLDRCTRSNTGLMSEMISIYLEQTPPLIALMKKSLNEKDWESLGAASHKMIPSFSIVGMSEEYEEMAVKIQDFANSQHQEEEISEMLDKLEVVCEQAYLELREELLTLKMIK